MVCYGRVRTEVEGNGSLIWAQQQHLVANARSEGKAWGRRRTACDIKASTIQGESFNVRDKVAYQGREMIVTRGKDSEGRIKMKPLEWLSGIAAIADALRVNGALTSLNLQENNLGAEGGKAVAQALHDNAIDMQRVGDRPRTLGTDAVVA